MWRRTICLATVLFVVLSSSVFCQLKYKNAQELITAINKKIDEIPPFEEAMKDDKDFKGVDLGLTEKKMLQMKKVIAQEAKKLTDEKFPEEMLERLKAEADKKYKFIKPGEEITLPIRYGRGFREYTGKLKSFNKQYVLVDRKRVPTIDIPEDVKARLDKNLAEKKIKDYLNTKYYEAKRNFLQAEQRQMEYDLRLKYEKAAEARYKLKKAKKKYEYVSRNRILREMIPEFIKQKLIDCKSTDSAKEQQLKYTALLYDAAMLEKQYGKYAKKAIMHTVDLKKLKEEVIPELEKKAKESKDSYRAFH